MNGTTWTSLSDFLVDPFARQVDLLIGQETHIIGSQACRTQEDWARRASWKLHLDEATPTGKGGTSGGLCTATHTWKGLASYPCVSTRFRLAQGRVQIRCWNGWLPGGVVVGNVYLHHSEGMTARNRYLLNLLMREVRRLNRPFLIGGDFNMHPTELAKSGVFEALKAEAVFTSEPTYGDMIGGTLLDYWVMPKALRFLVVRCYQIRTSTIKDHRPVALELKNTTPSELITVQKVPKCYPTVRPIGPAKESRAQWQRAHTVLQDSELGPATLARGFQAFMEGAEEELGCIYHLSPEEAAQHAGRGRRPTFIQVHPYRKNNAAVAKASTEARQALWVGDRCYELARAMQRGTPAHLREAEVLYETLGKWKGKLMHTAEWGSIQPRWSRLRRLDVSELDELAAAAHDIGRELARCFEKERCRSFDGWAKKATADGAGLAHKWTRGPTGASPGLLTDGVAANIQDAAHQFCREWLTKIWNVGDPAPEHNWAEICEHQLREPSVEALRKASRSFKQRTALGSDAFHPRWFAMLSDDALEFLGRLFVYMERVGQQPQQLVAIIVFLAKKEGGVRPIALLGGFLRVWTKVRREQMQQWETAHDLPCFHNATGRTAERAVWDQAVYQEWGTKVGMLTTSSQLDMTKAYERVGHGTLWKEGQ